MMMNDDAGGKASSVSVYLSSPIRCAQALFLPKVDERVPQVLRQSPIDAFGCLAQLYES